MLSAPWGGRDWPVAWATGPLAKDSRAPEGRRGAPRGLPVHCITRCGAPDGALVRCGWEFGPKGRFTQPRPKAWDSGFTCIHRPEGPVHAGDGMMNGPFRAGAWCAITNPRLRLGLTESALQAERPVQTGKAEGLGFRVHVYPPA
jgi:hypothetical protein